MPRYQPQHQIDTEYSAIKRNDAEQRALEIITDMVIDYRIKQPIVLNIKPVRRVVSIWQRLLPALVAVHVLVMAASVALVQLV